MTKRTAFFWIAALAVLVCCVTPHTSAAESYGTELPYTSGSGGRASALGLAATSLSGGPSQQYFNPAVLSVLQFKELEFFRTTFFDTKSAYHTFHYAHPILDYGTLGVSVLRLDVGGVEERNANNVLLSSDLKNAQTRVLLGYAASLHPSLAAGFNLKIDNQSFGTYSGSGVGADLGFLATRKFSEASRFEHIRGGLSIQNLIEPSIKLDQDDVADPLCIAVGGSAALREGNIRFVTAIDIVAPRFSPYRLRFGQEIGYLDLMAFRFGFDGSTPTFGAGATWRNVAVHYSYREEDLGNNHRFSVAVRFGASLNEQRENARAQMEAELDLHINTKLSELESSQLSETIKRADDLFSRNQYVEAAGQYELALLWDDNNERARSQIQSCRYLDSMRQARALMDEKNYLEALYHLHRAISLSKENGEAATLVDQCNQKIREQEDHTDMIKQMLTHSIDLYASRHFTEALSGFREILRIDPDNELAAGYEQKSYTNIQNRKQELVLRANNLSDSGDYAGAVTALEQALVLVPEDPVIRAQIADLRLKQSNAEKLRSERLTQERERARTARTSTPSSPPPNASYNPADLEPKYREGLRHFEKGDFDAAVRRFHDVWDTAPDFHNVTELLTKAYLFMGMKKYSEEKYDEAIVIWEKALVVDPRNSKTRRYLQKAREESSHLGNVNNNE